MAEAKACIARAEQSQGKASPQVTEFYQAVLQKPERSGPYKLALAHALLGQKEEALRSLQTAYEQREVMMPLAGTEPSFAGLHTDPRFRELVRKMGLADSY